MAKKLLLILLTLFLCMSLSASVSLEDGGFRMEGVKVKAGGALIDFTAGEAVPVVMEGKRQGFIFSGKGSITVNVTDPFSIQVLTYNLQHGSNLKAEGKTIKESFTSLLCAGTGAVKMIPEAAAHKTNLASTLEELKERFFDESTFQVISFVQAGLASGTGEFGCYIHGEKDDLIYVSDPIWRQEERLYSLDTSTIRRKGKENLRLQYTLLQQPIGYSRTAGKIPTLKMTWMKYEMDFCDFSNLAGTYELTYSASRNGLKALQLDLLNKVTHVTGQGLDGRSLFHEEIDYSSTPYTVEDKFLFIDGVTDREGKKLDYFHHGGLLTLFLRSGTKAGEELSFTVKVHGDIFEPTPRQGHHVALTGVSWFPSPRDGSEAVDALFSGSVKTIPPIYAYASVEKFTRKEKEGIHLFSGSSKYRTDYHALAIGKYFEQSLSKRGVDLTISSAVFKNDRAYEILTELTDAALETYDYYLDTFPYKHLFIIEGKGLGYGHAPPGMIFASGEIFNSLKDAETQLYSKGANERFANEVAHQYFGHMVRSRYPGDAWLTEALSEYMAAMFLKLRYKKKEFKHLYTFWYNRVKTTSDVASPYSAHLLDGRDAYHYYWDLTYCKGPVILHAMRDKMGDKKFFTILRSFVKSFPREKVTTEDFIGLVNYITKEDWHPFFEKYVYGTEMPKKSKKF